MTIQSLKPMLRTWDIRGTVNFYTQVLGSTCSAFKEDWGWANLQWEAAEIMLSGPNKHENDSAPVFTGSLYFMCDDVDDHWETLRLIAKICYPIENFEYGMREFAIYDNNGYILQFGSPIEDKT
jgi:uncharacterized glyoxalase superfamily protein PhnB